jgi:hypothetical protein
MIPQSLVNVSPFRLGWNSAPAGPQCVHSQTGVGYRSRAPD